MDNPEGQVTYPIYIGRPGYLPALAHQRCTLRFYLCVYNQAIVFMEVLSMNEALKTQLKILKLSDIKPNFSELARFYDLDRRTVKKYYDGYEGKAAHRDKPSKAHHHILHSFA